MQDPLEVFVSRLIEEKNFGDLDPEVLEQVKSDLLDRVNDRINARIVSLIPEDAMPEFERMVDANVDTAEVQKFCLEKVPNLDEFLAEELMQFRETYLG